jgi:hypothetical protein
LFIKNLIHKNLKIILTIFCLIFTSTSIFAQTSFQGGIYNNSTWTLANSPYTITGPVVVFPGKTLTIEPGVQILIDNSSNSDIYIEARGTINCIGTNQLPIKIRTLNDTTSVGWRGFVCTNSQGGVLNSNYFDIANAFFPFNYETIPTSLNYTNCKFRHCHQAITVGTNVNLNNCQLINNEVGIYGWTYYTINNCLFKDNTTAIYAYASAFVMSNCDFIDNQIGVAFQANAIDSIVISNCEFLNNELALNYPNNGKVYDCIFSDNTSAIKAIYDCEVFNNQIVYNEYALEASVNAVIHNNQINNNFGGVLISYVVNNQESPSIYDNEICNNINYSVNNNTNMNYSLLENCFCGLDSSAIELSIIDGYDDISKGLINYDVYDVTCTNITKTVLKYVVPGTASTDDLASSSSINVFPNPFQNEITIQSEVKIDHLQLFSLEGRLILELENLNTTNPVLTVPELENGTYTLVINHSIFKQLNK